MPDDHKQRSQPMNESPQLLVWRFCEKCGGSMQWIEEIGKFSPVTGDPELHWYYQCSVSANHQPQAVESGPFRTFINRELATVQVPERA